MTSSRNERPILFSAPMVRALLAGTKTQTRRVVKNPALLWLEQFAPEYVALPGNHLSPYGYAGDRLWVRETWQFHGGMLDGGTASAANGGLLYKDLVVSYPADGARVTLHPNGQDWPTPEQPPQREGEVYSLRDAPEDFLYDGENTYCDRLSRWWGRKIPAIHMYRWTSRIDLEVTGVRVERLQGISETDAWAEGISACTVDASVTGRDLYRVLWEKINGAGSWAANPWVWVVEFRRIEP